MEKTTTTTHSKSNFSQRLYLLDRKHISIDAVNEVKRSNNTEISLILSDKTAMTIQGTDISITKLDIESGTIEATGVFTSILYGSKQNIFKRIFK